ncbi:hypothetical protein N9850_04035 [Granulosicoccus sp.]|nr:hypothetical protein [Granulosicoccus sp.]MDB4222918.1 hypothetical protein [Granulosicoccus sp.]
MTQTTSTPSVESDEDDSPAKPSADPLLRKLEELAAKSIARDVQRQIESDTAAESTPIEATTPTPGITPRFGQSTHTRMAAIERDMQRMEHDGFFVSFPIRPENEFPTLLTRLPIFRPTRRRHQQRLQNVDNAIEFSTPFGTGKRHGPPLTVRDEDTLIALMRLRSRRLIGNPTDLPVSVSNIYQTETGRVGVHYVACSVDQLNTEMGLTNGGSNFNATFESVKRLGATQLELNLNKHDRYLNLVTTGRMIPIIQVQWQVHQNDGLLVVLFPPVIAQWLDKEYTYIDWSVRRQLGDLGKALHRFLSAQPKRYENTVAKICETIGYDGPSKNAKQRLGGALEELIKVGWLTSYEFEGTGRKTPLLLKINRT